MFSAVIKIKRGGEKVFKKSQSLVFNCTAYDHIIMLTPLENANQDNNDLEDQS